MSDTTATTRRQLKIKTGAVKRLLKENNLYKKEAEQQQRTVDKYAADGAEEYDLKNQQKLLVEAQKMIPESQKLLGAAVADLRELVVNARTESAFQGDDDLAKAEEVLEEASV